MLRRLAGPGLMCLFLAGCGGGGSLGLDALDGNNPVPGMDSGLEVQQLRLADDRVESLHIAGVLNSFELAEVRSSIEPAAREQLRRNGLRIIPIDATRIDEVKAGLERAAGRATWANDGWHGQATTWRPIAVTGTDGVAAYSIDGRVAASAGEEVRLSFRGWTIATLNGPRVQTELRFEMIPVERARPRIASLPEGVKPRPIGGLAVEFESPSGIAWVVTTAQPEDVWSEDEAQASSAARPPALHTSEREFRTAPTIGEMLLRDRDMTTREVLIFVPLVPARMLETSSIASAAPGASSS